MPVREGNIDSDGVAIHYLDWGGEGPALVLSHATGFLGALWRPIAEPLSRRFRTVAYDQRGCGDSDKPSDGYDFRTLAADLQHLIEGLELQRPLVAGHSSGGTTAVVHAATYPGVISRLVLIEPILPRAGWTANAQPGERNANSLAEGARKRRAVWPSTLELFESYRARETFETWREDVLRIYVEEGTRQRDDGQIELKCPPELEAKFFEAVVQMDFWPLLERVERPALVLWGGESHVRGRLAAHVLATLPNAREAIVPGASHFLPQERPDEIARLMEQFLSD
jgi:pimeloyl-ACP methyl ester carboxylesterase